MGGYNDENALKELSQIVGLSKLVSKQVSQYVSKFLENIFHSQQSSLIVTSLDFQTLTAQKHV